MLLSERKTPKHRLMAAAKPIPIFAGIMAWLVSVPLQARMESVESHLELGKSNIKNSKTKPLNSRLSIHYFLSSYLLNAIQILFYFE